jgi:hypothetical protein
MSRRSQSYKKNAPPQPEDGLPAYSAAKLHAMDRAFAERLRAAIELGLEQCPVGVVTAPSTKCPRLVPRPPTMIGRSSFDANPTTRGWR